MRTTFCALAVSLMAGPALADMQHPFSYPQPEDSAEFFTVIEIPDMEAGRRQYQPAQAV